MKSEEEREEKIIFFDGVCSLCSASVDFIIKRDKKKTFKFSSLQSDYAQENLPEKYTKDLNTIVFMDNEKIYIKSRAVLKILSYMNFPWNVLSILKIIPNFITDLIYKIIAKKRYSLFGKRKVCRIPTENEVERFIS